MIELIRYARLKPKGVTSATLTADGLVSVKFKRFDVQTGEEIPSEESLITFEDLEVRLAELHTELEVVKELLDLKPKA